MALAKDTDCKTWAWEGLAIDQIVRKAEFATKCAGFIFKEQTKRLNNFFKIDIVWQAANIVMAFDDSSLSGT